MARISKTLPAGPLRGVLRDRRLARRQRMEHRAAARSARLGPVHPRAPTPRRAPRSSRSAYEDNPDPSIVAQLVTAARRREQAHVLHAQSSDERPGLRARRRHRTQPRRLRLDHGRDDRPEGLGDALPRDRATPAAPRRTAASTAWSRLRLAEDYVLHYVTDDSHSYGALERGPARRPRTCGGSRFTA